MTLDRVAPGIGVLRRYDRSWLTGDLLGGVAVAAYLVPQVMAYAEIAGVPAAAGLAAICASLLVYAVIGSSRQLSVGPESTTALMTAVAVAPLAAGDPARYGMLAAGLAVLVGVICLLARVARAGALADLLSMPVLVGYLTGVALNMIVSQMEKVTGVPVDGDSVPAEVASFIGGLGALHVPTTILAAVLLTFLLVGARLFPRWPVALVGMLLAAAAVALFDMQERFGIAVVGQAATGLQAPALPTIGLADWSALLLPALGIAVVGYSDNMLTARSFASRKGETVDGNTELVALGAANIVAGVVRGFPVSSSGSRTAIGDAQGSRTQLHSLVAVALVVLILLFGRDVLAGFPAAALGAVVVYAALRLIDIAAFRRIARFRNSELVLALTTTVAVLVFGVLYGVLAAIAVSVVELLRRLARPHDAVLGFVPDVAGMHDLADYPDAKPVDGLVVYRYDAPLCFANAEDFRRSALVALESGEHPRWFVLNAEANVEIDITAADALDALIAELRRRGVVFAMARVKQDLRDVLVRAGLLATIGEDKVFMTLPTAVEAFRQWERDHPR
ncbi:SulP family inorganic anion transporter [Pseudonocardia sp. TRM90224]|uniref:SulP family inorganic anion transporter n=1 Tax=Pseudonocardia sp. TRM90224 TaxID=2812678 RepID=UPI001E36FABA|nr:SulP family inorganic anion transporter [Pseudonocardia sp. TRM90224]